MIDIFFGVCTIHGSERDMSDTFLCCERLFFSMLDLWAIFLSQFFSNQEHISMRACEKPAISRKTRDFNPTLIHKFYAGNIESILQHNPRTQLEKPDPLFPSGHANIDFQFSYVLCYAFMLVLVSKHNFSPSLSALSRH